MPIFNKIVIVTNLKVALLLLSRKEMGQGVCNIYVPCQSLIYWQLELAYKKQRRQLNDHKGGHQSCSYMIDTDRMQA